MGRKSKQQSNADEDETNDPTASPARDGNGLSITRGPYAEGLRDLVDIMEKLKTAATKSSAQFEKHAADIATIDRTIEQCAELRQKNVDIEQEMAKLHDTIDVLTGKREALKQKHAEDIAAIEKKSGDRKRALDAEGAKIDKRRQDLEQDRQKFEKSLKVRLAEEEQKTREQQAKVKADQDARLKEKQAELESSFEKKEKALQKLLQGAQDEKNGLEQDLKAEQEKFNAQQAEISEKEKIHAMTRRSHEKLEEEKKALQQKYEKLKSSFGLQNRGVEFFQAEFSKIQKTIAEISSRYLRNFSDMDPLDLDKIHEELTEIDPLFEDVPISDSSNSQLLIQAHMQRVIAHALCDNIWLPFSAVRRLDSSLDKDDHGETREVLDRMRSVIAKQATPRAATVFRTQTAHALQQLPSAHKSSPNWDFRGEDMFDDVKTVFEPLIDPEKLAAFEAQIRDIGKSAITLWDCVETDEWQILVTDKLENFHYAFCRHPEFDPAENCPETPAQTPQAAEIFMLFPKIDGRKLTDGDDAPDIPGSFPRNTVDGRVEVVPIHNGVGLSTTSRLVEDGRQELIDDKELIEALVRKTKKEMNQSRSRTMSQAGPDTISPSKPR